MAIRIYNSPEAFKQALEQRLRSGTQSGVEFARRRQLLVFDRFLARIAAVLGDAAILKGGLALELRLTRARATKDVDLRFIGSHGNVLTKLQRAARHDLDDFMRFEIRPDGHHPKIQNDGMIYDGLRFKADCHLAGKPYGHSFGVDVAFGDPILGEPEVITANDILGFAGIPPPALRLYPVETHVAEKLHAYTMPRPRPNSRVKDLPDIALLASTQPLKATRLRGALEQTFEFRGTHELPAMLPEPPSLWDELYVTMARADKLEWPTLAKLMTAARAFLDPVLAGGLDAQWAPRQWVWKTRRKRDPGGSGR